MTHTPIQMPEPCPICGKQPKEIYLPEIEYKHGEDTRLRPASWHYECKSLTHTVHVMAREKHEAIAAWNTRAASVPSEDERLKELSAQLIERGYVDAKFYYGVTKRDAIEMIEAVLAGKTKPFTPFNDSTRSAVPSDKERAEALEWFKRIVRDYPATMPDYYPHNLTIESALTAPEQSDATPCVSCGNPSDTSTPDDAEMCWKCFGEFNAAAYDEQKETIKALADSLINAKNMCKAIVEGYPDPDITHVDYRVQVTKWAQDYLDDDAEALAMAEEGGE